jgi:hypothetical protein
MRRNVHFFRTCEDLTFTTIQVIEKHWEFRQDVAVVYNNSQEAYDDLKRRISEKTYNDHTDYVETKLWRSELFITCNRVRQ